MTADDPGAALADWLAVAGAPPSPKCARCFAAPGRYWACEPLVVVAPGVASAYTFRRLCGVCLVAWLVGAPAGARWGPDAP